MHIGAQRVHGRALYVLTLAALIFTMQVTVMGQTFTGTQGQASLEAPAKELQNPMSKIWSLVFQNNLNLQQGKAVDETAVANNFVFQPALPLPLGRKAVFISRPVFPILSFPSLDSAHPGEIMDRNTGIGDIQLLTLVGVTTTSGLVYAAVATFTFPTASEDNLGSGKYQAGPSVALAKIGRKASYGISVQHWWSYAGDEHLRDVSQTNFGYSFNRTVQKVWSIGLSPTIGVSWNAPDGNTLTLPIGFGASRMTRIGSTPVRFRIEAQYSIIRPESYGTQWNFRFRAVPVICNPFDG